uniref:C-type lectin domain-containing protein n=1 Tax=Chelonoidis abingdonii TaxID=106734 RepID=A0A8C0ISM8_CHEAB
MSQKFQAILCIGAVRDHNPPLRLVRRSFATIHIEPCLATTAFKSLLSLSRILQEQGEGQAWKWTNGTVFNNLFQVRGEGQCAYLDEYGVSSSRCYSERHFICKRPDECSKRKPSAAGGDTIFKIA